MSAANIVEQIDTDTYNLLLIGITEEGRWLKAPSLDSIRDGSWKESCEEAVILPDATKKCALIKRGASWQEVPVDVAFPVLHGLYGEDGTVQGLFELARIPYVGCGVLASAVSMDKLYTKIVVDDLGIRQAAYEPVMKEQLSSMDEVVNRIEARFSYPVFIKPSNAGSQIEVQAQRNREDRERSFWKQPVMIGRFW